MGFFIISDLEPPRQDGIFLRSLALSAIIGPDTWHRPGKLQPALVDLRVFTTVTNIMVMTDDVHKTILYGNLCNKVTEAVADEEFENIGSFLFKIAETAFKVATEVEVKVTLPKALLLADGIGLQMVCRDISMGNPVADAKMLVMFVENLRVACVIGVNAHERMEKQQVVINLKMEEFKQMLYLEYATVMKAVVDEVEKSTCETLECMATFIGGIVCRAGKVGRVTVSVEKPSALMFVAGSGVEITRTAGFYGAVHDENEF